MNILEALNWGRDELKTTLHEKVESGHNPTLDAQVLLSHCLKKPTAFLFSHFEDELGSEIADKYQKTIKRRKHHEPVAYITGEQEFYGRNFTVNNFVLIPRPETELIIDEIKKLIKDDSSIIDVGTGPGTIAVTLAAETGLPVIATEIDQNSMRVGQLNAENHNVDHLISFQKGDLLSPYFEKNIDESNLDHMVIAANLPYEKLGVWQNLDPDVINFEPKHAIIGGVDGLDYYDKMFAQITSNRHKMPKDVHILFEITPSQELTAPRLVREYFPSSEIELLYDLANKPRLVICKI